MRRRPLFVAWLVVAWVLLWGRLSWANVLSGLAVVTVVLIAVPIGGRDLRTVVRPLAVLHLAGRFAFELVRANVALTRAILSRHDPVRTAVVAVPLDDVSDGVVTVVANLTALTPGTIVVEVRRDPTVLYVHVMAMHDRAAVVHEVREWQRLAVAAFGGGGTR